MYNAATPNKVNSRATAEYNNWLLRTTTNADAIVKIAINQKTKSAIKAYLKILHFFHQYIYQDLLLYLILQTYKLNYPYQVQKTHNQGDGDYC